MNITDLRDMLKVGVLQPEPAPVRHLTSLTAKLSFDFDSIPCEDGHNGCRRTPSGLVPSMTMYEWKVHTAEELFQMPFRDFMEVADKLNLGIEAVGPAAMDKKAAVDMVMKAEAQQDPNRDRIMCEECAAEYMEMMQSQWDDYHSGLI